MARSRSATSVAAIAAALAIIASATGAAPSAAQRGTSPSPAGIRLYVFNGGMLGSDPARYELTVRDVGVTDLAVAAYLIVHPRGLLMWETGAIPDSEWTPTGGPVLLRFVLGDGRERSVTLTRSLGAQLMAAGYEPADITHLALSHYHWDHTANANLFTNATWLVRQAEREAMAGGDLGTARPETYAGLLKNDRTVIVTADEHDVFGDGTVILKAAPGHTPGHQVLYVKLAETGPVVLSGDLYHYRQERTLGTLPVNELDADATRASRTGIEAFLARTKAQLWIQHDLRTHRSLKKAPEFYR